MQNIYVFTTHKAASMLLYEIGRKLAHHAKILFWSVNDKTFPEKGPVDDPNAFDAKEGCFCPLRFCMEVPDIDESAIILHLRDPRDAMTSMFFSHVYSHPPVPGGWFNPTAKQRQQWSDEGIDGYTRRISSWWLRRYQDYCDNLLGRPNTIFVKYEEMVTDFPSWLERFAAPFPIARKRALVRKLARKYRHNFDVGPEDVYRHKRQVTPGDHKRKLKPETIAFLNEKFAPVLAALGYEP